MEASTAAVKAGEQSSDSTRERTGAPEARRRQSWRLSGQGTLTEQSWGGGEQGLLLPVQSVLYSATRVRF